MTDENPYRSPEAYGTTLRPSRWLSRGWKDAPAVVCAVIGGLIITSSLVVGALVAFNTPGNLSSGIAIGLVVGTWGLIWIASAENWWKGNTVSALVWLTFGMSPLLLGLAML